MIGLAALALLIGFVLFVRARLRSGRWTATRLQAGLWIVAVGALLCAFVRAATGEFPSSILLIALLLALQNSRTAPPRLNAPAFLNGHGAVAVAGLLSAAAAAFVWGSTRPVPVIHDEAAYLLQARIFASGRWIAPARPLPEFFEQMHVFVTPFLAAKYPPGYSLLLTPGVWLGWPPLVPVVLNGLAGSLLFAHARRFAGAAVALVCWLVWVSNPGTFAYRASYLSGNATTVFWLLSLWALWEWLERGGRRWVVLLAFCLGWGAITRPMTMFAFGVPIGFVFLRRVVARGSWRDLAIAAAVGGACLAILPVWSARTTGDWRTSPYRSYSRVYAPYEWMGFGVRPDPPLRPLPRAVEPFHEQLKRVHSQHTVRALPVIFLSRLYVIARDQWWGMRKHLRLFAVPGALALDGAGVFALISSLGLVIGHLFYAHSAAWSPYYLEIQVFLSFVTALGLCSVLASVEDLRMARGASAARTAETRRGGVAFALLVLALLVPAIAGLTRARGERSKAMSYQASFRDRVERLPANRAIVFVRYGRSSNVHRALVVNEPDLGSARAWVVHDLGDRDADLARLSPERQPYLYDDDSGVLAPFQPK